MTNFLTPQIIHYLISTLGGYLGYQWADFHCGFEMTFLCEYDVNDIEAWRRRRQYQGRMEPDLQKLKKVRFFNSI